MISAILSYRTVHGRLISYSRSGDRSLTHVYNGLDDRVATTTTPSGGAADTRRFLTAPDGRTMGEYGGSATDVKAEFIWMSPEVGDPGSRSGAGSSTFGGDDGLGGYMPLAIVNGTTLSWTHGNHMGVPIAYTNSSGAIIAAPTGYSAPGFPGQLSTFADLYYNRYRDYDPSTGGYIQADPIGLAGGANPYSYAMGNPVRYVDPLGLEIANLFPLSEPDMRQAAFDAYNKLPKYIRDSALHVYGHGGGMTQCDMVRKNCDTAEEFSDKLLMNPLYKYKLDQEIYLYSCNTGSLDNGFAKRLAGFLQVNVYAPPSSVWYLPGHGIVGIGNAIPFTNIKNPFSNNKLRKFTP
jgi:RHS repeat-associated protein